MLMKFKGLRLYYDYNYKINFSVAFLFKCRLCINNHYLLDGDSRGLGEESSSILISNQRLPGDRLLVDRKGPKPNVKDEEEPTLL